MKPVLTVPEEAQAKVNRPIEKPLHPAVVKVIRSLVFWRSRMWPTTRTRCLAWVSSSAIRYHQEWHRRYGSPGD